MSQVGVFPLFSQRFLHGPLLPKIDQDSSSSAPERLLLQPMEGAAEPGHHLQRPNLRTLDLRGLQRDDGPPSETQLRRMKFQHFDKQCSLVDDNLFLSGDTVARSREKLQENGITHVLNCVGFVCKEYFKDELEYRTYFLQDTPAEDIVCILYDAFEFIDQAIEGGGKVLVHCSQGVSRSATVVIAYLMMKLKKSYDEVFAMVKERRGVANPNIGFTCQLLQWQKRRRSPPAKSRMYRIGPHCQHAPLLLVPRLVTPPKQYETHTWRQLDPRGAFIVQTPSSMYVWVGSQCPQPMAEAAHKFAELVLKYEEAKEPNVQTCQQGSEPDEFVRLMDPPTLDADAERQNARRSSITGELYGTLGGPNSSTSFHSFHTRNDSMDTDSRSCTPTSEHFLEGGPRISDGLDSSDMLATSSSCHNPQASVHLQLQVPDPTHMPPGEGLLSSHPLMSPMLISPAVNTPIAGLVLSQSKAQLARNAWRVSPIEEYTPDFQLYMDSMRAQHSVTPGSEEAIAMVMAGSRHSTRDLRLSVTGTELVSDLMHTQGPLLTPAGPSDGTHGPAPWHSPMGAAGLMALHREQSVGRPQSPSPGMTNLKKVKRSETMSPDKGLRLSFFPSLHQSLDDEDMP